MLVKCFASHSCFTGATAAQLWGHQQNINVTNGNKWWKMSEKLKNLAHKIYVLQETSFDISHHDDSLKKTARRELENNLYFVHSRLETTGRFSAMPLEHLFAVCKPLVVPIVICFDLGITQILLKSYQHGLAVYMCSPLHVYWYKIFHHILFYPPHPPPPPRIAFKLT